MINRLIVWESRIVRQNSFNFQICLYQHWIRMLIKVSCTISRRWREQPFARWRTTRGSSANSVVIKKEIKCMDHWFGLHWYQTALNCTEFWVWLAFCWTHSRIGCPVHTDIISVCHQLSSSAFCKPLKEGASFVLWFRKLIWLTWQSIINVGHSTRTGV